MPSFSPIVPAPVARRPLGSSHRESMDPLGGFQGTLGEFLDTVGEIQGTVGEFLGTVGEYLGTVGELGTAGTVGFSRPWKVLTSPGTPPAAGPDSRA